MTDSKGDEVAANMAMATYMKARAADALTHIYMGAAMGFLISLGLVALAGFIPIGGDFVPTQINPTTFNPSDTNTSIPGLEGWRILPVIHWNVPPTLLLLLALGFLICGVLAIRSYYRTHEILNNIAAMVAIDDQEGSPVFGGGSDSDDATQDPQSDDQKV